MRARGSHKPSRATTDLGSSPDRWRPTKWRTSWASPCMLSVTIKRWPASFSPIYATCRKRVKQSRYQAGASRWLISMDAASTRSWPCAFRSRVGCYEASDAALKTERLVIRLAFPTLPCRQHVTEAASKPTVRKRFLQEYPGVARLGSGKRRAPRGLGAHTRLRQVERGMTFLSPLTLKRKLDHDAIDLVSRRAGSIPWRGHDNLSWRSATVGSGANSVSAGAGLRRARGAGCRRAPLLALSDGCRPSCVPS